MEDLYYDYPRRLPRPAPPTPRPEPEPPVRRMSPECENICRNGDTCQKLIKILTNNDRNDCKNSWKTMQSCIVNQMNNNFYYQYQTRAGYEDRCPIRQPCPTGHLFSGFGSDRSRCISLEQCKYLQQIYKHVNEIHSNIEWN